MGFIQPGKSLKRSKKKKDGTVKKQKVVTSQAISNFERLPNEIILYIFLLTGLEQNSLPLVNKRFNKLLKINTVRSDGGYWPMKAFVEDLIRVHFIHDLNKNLNFDRLEKKLQKYKTKVPSNDSTVETVTSLLQTYSEKRFAVNAMLFSYKFVSLRILDLLHYDNLVAMKLDSIEKECDRRTEMVKKFMKQIDVKYRNATDVNDDDVAQYDNQAEVALEQFNFVNREQDHDDSDFVQVPQAISSLKLPERCYRVPQFEAGLDFIERLIRFGFSLDRERILKSTLESLNVSDDPGGLLRRLALLCNNFVTVKILIEAFELCLHSKEDNMHIYNDALDFLMELFFENTCTDLDKFKLWEYVIGTKNHTFLNKIMKYTQSPTGEVLELINRIS